MALRKSDLYSSLWASADELRGGMDASQYKDYVLTLLFVKYVSDKAKTNRGSLVDVPKDGSFDFLVDLIGKPNIGEEINKSIRRLADANPELIGVITKADFNDAQKLGDGKAMQDRLSNLIAIFLNLDFTGSNAEGDDLLGDAYEYLMRHFATESCKSKGQFYTPAEVSRVMAQLLGIAANTPASKTVYDPTCGSGSLLIKVADYAPSGLTIYGQEQDEATWALARMNMVLHSQETADLRRENTLADPQFLEGGKLKTFDFVVANPPFSLKSWTNGFADNYGIFDGFPIPPTKNGDFAFLLHMIKSLKSTGKAAVILPHGVLFRGNAEGDIRREIIRHRYIKGVIGLPANLFYGTGIPACILVLDKEGAKDRTGLFMIDASKDFEKDGAKNRLRPRDMHKIIDTFTRQLEIDRYSRLVPIGEIEDAKNDCNLNIPRYIDSSEPEDIQDLHAHFQGGIPNRDLDALEPYWEAFPSFRSALFRSLREGYSELAVAKEDVRSTITESSEYKAFAAKVDGLVADWWQSNRTELETITSFTRPADLIGELGESLLRTFRPVPLLDEYGVYEQLMRYWTDVMHDDVVIVLGEDWDGAAKPREAIVNRDKKLTETPDLVIGSGRNAVKWKMDLLPRSVIIGHYFSAEQTELDALNAEVEVASQAIDEFLEENCGEEGILTDAEEDEKINKAWATTQLRQAKRDDPKADDAKLLAELVALFTAETDAKKAAKDAAIELDKRALAQYGKLTVEDIKSLVIDDKWGATISRGVASEVDMLVQRLVDRLSVLGARYEETVGELCAELERLTAAVNEHLVEMGVMV